jgi:hypothetical protein
MSVARLSGFRTELRFQRYFRSDQCCFRAVRIVSSGARGFRSSALHGKTSQALKASTSNMDSSTAEIFRGTTSEELQTWLEKHHVDTRPFGVGRAKSMDALLKEITEGESVLESQTCTNGRAIRKVSVVNVRILNERGQELIERQQILPSGIIRNRQQPLGEKCLPDEAWVDAAKRGILEELGSVLPPDPVIRIDESTYVREEETKESQSYPGLETHVSKTFHIDSSAAAHRYFYLKSYVDFVLQYACHKVQAHVPQLPQENFSTSEMRPNGVLTFFWEWR